ncbi:MAG: hypothetical protein OHK0012_15720 [Synechococcales cyanobacterium]
MKSLIDLGCVTLGHPRRGLGIVILTLLALVPSSPSFANPTPTRQEILQACARQQADQLPNPFTDISESDWAYKAVLTLHYCGAYRGAIPPEQYQRYLDAQAPTNNPI